MWAQEMELRNPVGQSFKLAINSEHLFHSTRGRFVCIEVFDSSQRRVRFDVNELMETAAKAIGAEHCIDIKKLPEGLYNKPTLLTFNNASQVVAKVPNPNAGLSHYTTASEVATMVIATRNTSTLALWLHAVQTSQRSLTTTELAQRHCTFLSSAFTPTWQSFAKQY
ncbi:hypothetical protein M011DRAFT_17646 [Sporormia fimetaria CBS 119925]|uniref:Aminoglycoside phosphotransferase domain-containing protein n=1 Tax=Sporormia fimetaria CBS 119925 TaxID=1340428 RepID=A0A6A6VQK2_9PLEO|nr:hypothetical protein M011DRAFT_17646 [Sporormia fimetaria CBS 119925]